MDSDWTICEGLVDGRNEHIKLYSSKIVIDSKPTVVALLAPGGERNFTVQFVLNEDDSMKNVTADTVKEIIREVRENIEYYLLNIGSPHPWEYAIYRATMATANVY